MILIHISYSKFMEGINFQNPRSWEIQDGEMIAGGLSFSGGRTHGGCAKPRIHKALVGCVPTVTCSCLWGTPGASGESRLSGSGASCYLASYSSEETGLVPFLSPMLPVSDQEIKHGVEPPRETIRKKQKSWRGPTSISTTNSAKCLTGLWVVS